VHAYTYKVDEESPFVREWAIWGIRNLCEANPAIQTAIQDLAVVDVVDNAQLAEAGIRFELAASGKLRMLPRDKA
jgi:ataxin-10